MSSSLYPTALLMLWVEQLLPQHGLAGPQQEPPWVAILA